MELHQNFVLKMPVLCIQEVKSERKRPDFALKVIVRKSSEA